MARLLLTSIVLVLALPLGAAPVPKHLMKERPLTEAIQGRWQLTSRIEDGVASDPELIRNRRMVIGDGTYTLYHGTEELLTTTFKVDATQKPHHYDITDDRFRHSGVVKLESGVLTICLGPPGGARATEFDSPKGKGRILVTYTRIE